MPITEMNSLTPGIYRNTQDELDMSGNQGYNFEQKPPLFTNPAAVDSFFLPKNGCRLRGDILTSSHPLLKELGSIQFEAKYNHNRREEAGESDASDEKGDGGKFAGEGEFDPEEDDNEDIQEEDEEMNQDEEELGEDSQEYEDEEVDEDEFDSEGDEDDENDDDEFSEDDDEDEFDLDEDEYDDDEYDQDDE